MKKTIEIDDTLKERLDDAIEEINTILLNHLEANAPKETPLLYKDLDNNDYVHGVVDGWVPINNWEVKDTWYLYEDELKEAYENAGRGNDPRENYGMTAIYCYINEGIRKWYEKNAEIITKDFIANNPDKYSLDSEDEEEEIE